MQRILCLAFFLLGCGSYNPTPRIDAGIPIIDATIGSRRDSGVDSGMIIEVGIDAGTDAGRTDPGPPRERRMHFSEAQYTTRKNWVIPCPPGHPRHLPYRNYAFTATSADHDSLDCDGGFVPGGDRRGTAIFVFNNVAPARYDVYVTCSHNENRSRDGSIFTVNGIERRVMQYQSASEIVETRIIEGIQFERTITVILDSSRNNYGSDSISRVRIVPR